MTWSSQIPRDSVGVLGVPNQCTYSHLFGPYPAPQGSPSLIPSKARCPPATDFPFSIQLQSFPESPHPGGPREIQIIYFPWNLVSGQFSRPFIRPPQNLLP